MNKETNLTYQQAIEELEQIISELENENIDLDDLLKKVERATFLITYCKKKLKNSKTNLEKSIQKLEEDDDNYDDEENDNTNNNDDKSSNNNIPNDFPF